MGERKRETRMKKRTGKKNTTSCESCVNYIYDEDYGYYICEADLDEDEMSSFMRSAEFQCPYYRLDDEYAVVRRQM